MTDDEDRLSHQLSVCEKPRIAIVTVLSMQPEILVLDEPSAGLDLRARRTLMDLLRCLPQNMLISTHDIRLVAELFLRTGLMDHGGGAADGLTDAIVGNAALLEAHGLELP